MYKSLFLLGLIAFSQVYAATLQAGAQSVIHQLRDFEIKNQYGQQFVDLVQLKLEQGSQVQAVLELIGELLNQLRTDQQLDDVEHATQMAQFTNDIQNLQQSVEQMTQDLADTNNFLVVVNRELDALRSTIANLQAQLDVLNGKEEEIRTARANDEIAYNRRTQQNQRVIQALNMILEKLSAAVLQEQDRQGGGASTVQSLIQEMSQTLGPNHPITILVSITTQFDIPTVTNIIEKLEQIRDGVLASQVDDDAHEVEAIAVFQTLIQEITDLRDRLSEDLSNYTQVFNRKENERILAERTRDQLQHDLPITQQILELTMTQQEQYHASYQMRSHDRGQEIEIVQAAHNLISENIESTRRTEQLSQALSGQ